MSTKPKVILYWLEQSRSQRILWLLRELDLPYELKVFKRDPKTHLAPPELKKIHPLGKSPVIEVDGQVVAESGLICDYLVSLFGQDSELKPTSAKEDWDVKYCLHHAEGTLMTPFTLFYFSSVAKAESPFYIKPLVSAIMNKMDTFYTLPNIKSNLSFLEDKLKKNGTGFFVGDHLTSADIIYSFPLESIFGETGGLFQKADYPEIAKWLKLISERPAYIAANQAIAANPKL